MIRLRLIGDVVFTTPAIGAIRRRFPSARITYLVEGPAEPVVRHHPDLDEVLVLERPRGLARLRYDLRLAARLRAERFDLVVDFHGGPRSGLLSLASGARRRIGYALPGRRWCYTTRVPWSRSLVPPRHSVLNQWDLIAPLGIDPPTSAASPVVMPVDAGAAARVAERLAAAGVAESAPIVVLHVSAGNPFRRWPTASFAEVAATLALEDRARRIVITSGPSEAEAAEAVAAQARALAGPASDGILRTGEFNLSELRALVGRAALYIGGDSGPLHVAATTAAPIVALFGPTLPERSMPWRDPAVASIAVDAGPLSCRPCHQRHCVPGDFRCLTGISPTMVTSAAQTLLKKREAGKLKVESWKLEVGSQKTMNTLMLTAGMPPRDRLEQVGLLALVGIVATMQLSIAAAQILLTVAVLAWLVSHISRSERLQAPSFFWPLVTYAALTLASAGFSLDPAVSFTDCKQLVLFLLVPVTYDLARGGRANSVLSIILTIGAASAFVGIVQYGVLNFDGLGRRPQGTLSHWMTYSGTLMLVVCAATARLLYGTSGRLWAAFVMPALLVALSLTLTRGAWVGVAIGVAVLFLSKDFRLLALIPIVVVTGAVLAPQALTDRVYSIFDRNDLTSRDRVAMLQAGAAIVKDYPVMGVGPDQIERVYPYYRVPDAVKPTNPHLHNVPMQIAAERGLPALGAWLWFLGSASIGLVKLLRRSRHKALAAAGLGAVAAMLAAGLTEYNFGDSEFLMLLLVMITLPFAANRDGGLPS